MLLGMLVCTEVRQSVPAQFRNLGVVLCTKERGLAVIDVDYNVFVAFIPLSNVPEEADVSAQDRNVIYVWQSGDDNKRFVEAYNIRTGEKIRKVNCKAKRCVRDGNRKVCYKRNPKKATVNVRDTEGNVSSQQVWAACGRDGDETADGTTNVINVFRTDTDTEVDTDGNALNGTTPINLAGVGAFNPTSMAVVERTGPVVPTKVYVTMFDSDVVLIYQADPTKPGVYQLSDLPIDLSNGCTEHPCAGPRRIVIPPVVE